MALIESVLSVSGPARDSVAQDAHAAQGHWAPRVERVARRDGKAHRGAGDARASATRQIEFAARFGRNMEYYTGFVFELWSRDAEGALQVAGGGRYDTLLQSLGATRDIASVGCAIRPERVLAARRASGEAR